MMSDILVFLLFMISFLDSYEAGLSLITEIVTSNKST